VTRVGSRSLARAGLIVTAAFLASRVLGWIRLVVITTIYGAEADLDAYLAAFRIPDLIFQMVAAGAVGSALIPVLSGLMVNQEQARAWRVVSTVINVILVVLLSLAVLSAIFAPAIIPLTTAGFDPVQTELTIRLTRIMLLSPILLALGSVSSAVLNTGDRFSSSALAPILYNGALILSAVLLSPFLGIEAIALGVVIGSLAHVAVQLPALVRRQGFQYDFLIDLKDPAARQALLLIIPRAIGHSAGQITFIVNTTLASGLPAGSIVAYNVAFTILQIPLGVLGVPLGVVLLPSMSRAVAQGAMSGFGSLIVRSLRLLLFMMLFLTAVGIVLRREVVTLLFDYGRFDRDAIQLTADTLLFFMLGLAAHSLIIVLARAFYARQDTRTPVATALVSVAVNVVVSIATIESLQLAGLALGIAVGAWVEATQLMLFLRRKYPDIGLDRVSTGLLVFTVGAVVSGLAAGLVVRGAQLVIGTDPGKVLLFLEMLLATGAAMLVYALFSWLLRVPELRDSIRLARSALSRRRRSAS
jgi:putative peptidoglycan lipid II flippase